MLYLPYYFPDLKVSDTYKGEEFALDVHYGTRQQ